MGIGIESGAVPKEVCRKKTCPHQSELHALSRFRLNQSTNTESSLLGKLCMKSARPAAMLPGRSDEASAGTR
jgi:hypothetical protein